MENHNFNSSRLNVLKERKQDFSQEKLTYIEGEENIRTEKEELEEKIETFKASFDELEQEVQVERPAGLEQSGEGGVRRHQGPDGDGRHHLLLRPRAPDLRLHRRE